MAFIRIKKVRGQEYAYLVESKWDAEKHTSRQIVLKYLGSVEKLRMEAIPEEYRNDRVRKSILEKSDQSKRIQSTNTAFLQKKLLEALLVGNRKEAFAISEEARIALGLDSFYIDIITPVMQEIGKLWKAGEISITVEHLASNIMTEIVDRMNSEIRRKGVRRKTAVVCVPQGEQHSLALKVLDGLLTKRGLKSWNISASAPTESVIGFLESKNPNYVFISLTIPQYMPSMNRLAHAVRKSLPRARIFVGGQGVRDNAAKTLPDGTRISSNDTLEVLDSL